jgi:signal transduction histidine kinase
VFDEQRFFGHAVSISSAFLSHDDQTYARWYYDCAFGTAPWTPTDMVVRLSDDGPSIPPQLIPRLFTRYTRGAGEKERGSSRLGLAFCRLAVEAHGGTIRAMSAPQQGAAFSIRLPLGAAEQEPA